MDETTHLKRQSGQAKWSPFLIGLAVGATLFLVAPMLLNFIRPPEVADSESTSRDTRVIHSLQRTEEISLLSLGIQGIAERTEQRTIFGMRIPGADRALFMQYDFNAKLGLDGRAVRISELGEKSFRVTIPEFSFIGHDDIKFKVAVEKNGVLSWVTPEIDPVELTNSILDSEAKQQYLTDNEEVLRVQAQEFYKGIVAAIDPEIRLEFDYVSGR